MIVYTFIELNMYVHMYLRQLLDGMHRLLTSRTKPLLQWHPLMAQRLIVQLARAGPPHVSSQVTGHGRASSVVGLLQPMRQ